MNATRVSVRSTLQTWRDELRERREAQAARRSLEQELASYANPREIDELLSLISNDDSAEAEQIRDILTDNLARVA